MSKKFLSSYDAPSWTKCLKYVPKHRVKLANLPTPIEEFSPKLNVKFNDDAKIFIKRDDLTDFLMSGNKVRKLEFLIAEALEQGCNSTVTVGALQSNHCRATAVASRKVGLEPHLMLRSDQSIIPYEGNTLINRYMGAKMSCVSLEEYYKKGPQELVREKTEQLKRDGKNPYSICMGGSDYIGTFGYLNFIQEVLETKMEFDDIVFACGSGGTAAGISLGVALSGLKCRVVAVSVCDSAQVFHRDINAILVDLGACYKSEDILTIIDEYQQIDPKTEHELIKTIAQETTIIFDPTYTIKAVQAVLFDPRFQGRKVLLVHTGGYFGLEAKHDQIEKLNIFNDF